MDLPETNSQEKAPKFAKPTAILTNFPGKKRIIAIGGLVILVIVTVVAFYKLQGGTKPTSESAVNIQTSAKDTQDQQVIKNLTGFDWSNLPANPNGSEKQSLVFLLLLYSEETAVLRPEITATNLILPDDINKYQLVKLNTDVDRENLQKLIENLISIETIYNEKGLMSAKTHIERLQNLKSYFYKNLPKQKYKIPEEAKGISSGITVAQNQEDYAKALFTRYNNWLAAVTAGL